MNRRNFIKLSGTASVFAFTAQTSLLSSCHTEMDMMGTPNWIVEGNFETPLSVPTTITGDAILKAKNSSAKLFSGGTTATLTYSEGVLGPTLVANRGNTIKVELQNNLTEHTNVHWHGLVLPANMDGHPDDLVMPGNSFLYQLPILQRAGTYWYHPHPHEATARQVFQGLAGMLLVRDNEEAALNLPSGAYEVPLIIQDKRFSDSALVYAPTADDIMTGYLGENILVNGIHSPQIEVDTRWYRFRLLNGSTARVYNLGFSNFKSFYLIGTDGGLINSPKQLTSLMLAPGERADILVNFSDLTVGTEVYLKSFKFNRFSVQGRQEFSIMRFKVNRSATDNFVVPSVLSNVPKISTSSAIRTQVLKIYSLVGAGAGHGGGNKHGINGKTYMSEHIEFTVKAGTTEIWEFDNSIGDEIHPMHIHGVQFQVVSRVGGRNQVLSYEEGWKDTVMVMPQEKVRVIMTFPEYTGKFVLHCHNLEHEDDGMMLNYEIV